MARKTTTVYSCDRCGKKVDRPKNLRRFDLSSPRRRFREVNFEVCATCETEFLQLFAKWEATLDNRLDLGVFALDG